MGTALIIIAWYWVLIAILGTIIKSINRDITMQDAAAPWVLWPLMFLTALVATFWVCVFEKSNAKEALIEVWTTLGRRMF